MFVFFSVEVGAKLKIYFWTGGKKFTDHFWVHRFSVGAKDTLILVTGYWVAVGTQSHNGCKYLF